MIATLVLARDQREQLAREARDAFPRECCGLIEGRREGNRAIATALHPMRNIAVDTDRFELDPAAHIALSRTLRGTDRVIIGCYHSHPNGRAEPSARDTQLAAETGFVWLIQSGELRGFVWTGAAFSEVGLAVQALA